MNLRSSLVCTFALILLSAAQAAAYSQDPKISLELLAEHTALVPGKSTHLAVAFKIPAGWHIYWQNNGEGALDSTLAWQLPPGYRLGPVRFPPPRRHVDETGAHTFILEGEPVILAELSVPASAKPDEKVILGVQAQWLACKDICVQGKKTLSIQLPVVADPAKAEASDPLTFKVAQRALPTPADKPKYLGPVRTLASVNKVRPGDKFEVAVVVEVQPGHHLNSNAPLGKSLVPTDLFPARTENLTIGHPQFPPGQVEDQAPPDNLSLADRLKTPVEKLSLYRGQVVVRLPVEADKALTGDSVQIGGVVTYQACSDVTKTCFPPASAEWGLTLPIAKPGEPVQVVKLPGSDPSTSGSLVANPQPPTTRPAQDPGETTPVPQHQARSGDDLPKGGQTIGLIAGVELYLAGFGVLGQVLIAFIGGLLLNLMPCVLPVISIKILSFVQQAKESRLRVLTLGLAFAAGILVSFVILGLLVLGLLKGVGLETRWGGPQQIPMLMIGLAAVVTALALSLFGVFTLSPPQFVMEMGGHVQQEGHVNAFAMGLLATVLGTACTAPLVSPAVAWAATQTPGTGMLIFVPL